MDAEPAGHRLGTGLVTTIAATFLFQVSCGPAQVQLQEGRQLDLWDVAKVMWRRRWVAAPLALLTLIAAVFALFAVDPEYQVTAQVVVRPPEQVVAADSPEAANATRWSNNELAEWIVIYLNRVDVKNEVETAGFSPDYIAGLGGYGLTLIEIEVTAPSSDQAVKTRDRLIDMMERESQEQQSGADFVAGKAVTMKVADAGDVSVARTVGKRTLIVIMAVGLILTSAVSLWADAVIRRRTVAAVPPVPPARGKAKVVANKPAKKQAGLLPLSGLSWDTPVTPTLPSREGDESESAGKVR